MIRGTLLKQLKGATFFRATEMPIAKEIAIPADIRSIRSPPSLGGITNIQELIAAMQQLPVMISGTAYGRIAGQWYRVTFPRRIEDPHVVCTGMARAGDYITAEIPRVSKPTMREIARASRPSLVDIPREPREEIPPIAIEWPTKDEMMSETRAKLESGCNEMIKARIGDWLAPPWISTGTFCRGIANASFGRWLSDFWDKYVKSKFEALKKGVNDTVNLVYDKLYGQIDKATTAMQENINRLYVTETTDQINKVRDSIAVSMTDMYNSTNSQVNQIRDRVNTVIKDLYRMWGVPVGYILTPIHIRNITSTGFEFQSFGNTTIQFMAIGSGEGGE